MYVLDTDTCVFLLRGKGEAVAKRLRELQVDLVAVTAITAAELRFGALHSARAAANLEQVEQFLAPLQMLPFANAASAHFAAIKESLSRAGLLIGPMDLLIAATVRAHGATLVTNNVGEFERVPGLKVENWMTP